MLSLQSAGVAAVLLGLAVHLPWTLLQFTHLSQEPAPDVSYPHAAEYFYNVVTGETQWVDPGHTAFEDEDGNRYWLDNNGHRITYNPAEKEYVWVELFSEEQKRPYFYNQITKESLWERPADLGWRRIPLR